MDRSDANPMWVVLRLITALALFVAFSYGADWALRAQNFPVRSVRFEGPFRHVTREQLEHAILDQVRGNFFLVDLDALQRRLEALPWVDRASVRRLFPRDIAIRFSEQQLAAHWGDDAWLNTDGEVVRVTGDDLPTYLPRLDGPIGTAEQVYRAYQAFRTRLAPLDLKLVGLSLSARRSWRLDVRPENTERPLTLVVDHELPLPRLERFVRVYRNALAERAPEIRRVDLRYTNGFAVEWYPESANARVAHNAAPRHEG